MVTALAVWFGAAVPATADDGTAVPLYKPNASSPAALNILSDAYGGSRLAPQALPLGAPAPGFTLPIAGGGEVVLGELLEKGPVALIFYRGHW